MKTIIGFCTIMLLISTPLFSQYENTGSNNEVDGIFINITDFQNGEFCFHIDKKGKDEKIKINQFFDTPKIECLKQDKEIVLYKDSIFAIHTVSGESYRFINHIPYFIADTSYLFIYTEKTTKTEYFMSGPHRREKEVPVTYYYFSFGDHKSVFLLTLDNLHKYVLTESSVFNAVCDKFTNEEMLSELDIITGHFKLNKFLISIFKK